MNEELRRRIEAALSVHAPSAAKEMAARAIVQIEPRVSEWEASSGSIAGARIWFGMQGYDLGRLHMRPAIEDALRDAIARAVSAKDQVLADVIFHWAPENIHWLPYRGAQGARETESFTEALIAYCEAQGEAHVAARLRGGIAVHPADDRATVRISGANFTDDRIVLVRAITEILGPPHNERGSIRVFFGAGSS